MSQTANQEQSKEKHPIREFFVGVAIVLGTLALIDSIDINFVKE